MSETRLHMPAETVSPYAGFWRRAGAGLIDTALFVVPYILLAEKTVIGSGHASFIALQPSPALSLALGAIYWAYKAGLEASPLRGTIGKRALRIRVCDETGRRLSLPRATARSWDCLAAAAGRSPRRRRRHRGTRGADLLYRGRGHGAQARRP